MTGVPLLTAILAELERADDSLKRELARQLRPHVANDDRERLLDAGEKAAQLGLHPDTLARMARAGRVSGARKVGREWRFPAGQCDIVPVHPKASLSVVDPRPRRRSAASDRASVTSGLPVGIDEIVGRAREWYNLFVSHKEQVTIGERGRLVLPASVRSALGLKPGTRMLLSTEDDGSLRLRPYRTVADESRGLYADLVKDASLVDELLAERRAEAEHEE